MKTKLFLAMLASLTYLNGRAQEKIAYPANQAVKDSAKPASDNAREDSVSEAKIFTIVEEMPQFPGGGEKLYDYLKTNAKYPADAKSKGIKGKVYITFVVNEEGGIDNAKVLRGIGGGCDEEALRVVNKMPKWTPGRQNGRVVRVQYNVPVKFGVD